MSNTFFRFKEFTVHQDRCAMKVCTDACLFGAWMAARPEVRQCERLLDIGAGTGLLSLMLAQQHTHATIHAVEIDPSAAGQAAENFAASPWKHNVSVVNVSVTDYDPDQQYDCIFCNPPFYENDLPSADKSKNTARHSSSLNLKTLIAEMKRLLQPSGVCGILLPAHRSGYFEKLASDNGFYIKEKISVRQTPAHHFFRVMYFFSMIPPLSFLAQEIVIKEEGTYNKTFTALLKSYYLFEKTITSE